MNGSLIFMSIWTVFVAAFSFWVGSVMATGRWWPWRRRG